MKRLLAYLLHVANARPPWNRDEFYALKGALLEKYGIFRGHVIQVITKECWGEMRYVGYDGDQEFLPCGPKCRRCGGSGIFDRRWIRLEVWTWGKYVFHRPAGDTRRQPDSLPQSWIHGRIEHPDYGRWGQEACLWLYLLAGEWQLLWRSLRSSCACGYYWWPMLNLQRVVMAASMKLAMRTCSCGKRFHAWGSGWMMCAKCRRKLREPQEIPF